MRVLTYNIHSCVGTDGRCSPERLAETIAQSEPDVVALQELDHGRPRSHNVHQARVIARQLAMHFHFHPALRIAAEEYGDAILSRHPLRLIRAGALPTVDSGFFLEMRGALWVEIQTPERPWQVINTHFGLGRAERLLQAGALLGPQWVGAAGHRPPLIVCGDFNSHPGGRVHRLLASRLRDVQAGARQNTFPSRFPMLCLDHIFVGPGVRIGRVEVIRSGLAAFASDHLPLLAELEAG